MKNVGKESSKKIVKAEESPKAKIRPPSPFKTRTPNKPIVENKVVDEPKKVEPVAYKPKSTSPVLKAIKKPSPPTKKLNPSISQAKPKSTIPKHSVASKKASRPYTSKLESKLKSKIIKEDMILSKQAANQKASTSKALPIVEAASQESSKIISKNEINKTKASPRATPVSPKPTIKQSASTKKINGTFIDLNMRMIKMKK